MKSSKNASVCKDALFQRFVRALKLPIICAACLVLTASTPEAVHDLDFTDFFLNPIGPKGLELSPKIRDLNGKLVRIRGYAVDQENPPTGRLLLTPIPVQLHDEHYGLADDLPAATLFVSASPAQIALFRQSRGPITLRGRLALGNVDEPDGRISIVRLKAELSSAPRQASQSAKGGGAHLAR